jgi:hypothetical protein
MKIFLGLLLMLSCSFANVATIENVKVSAHNGVYNFAVKILHEDSGWKHYVNRYEVLDKDGNILATRTLWHPHEHEQPFTRSLNNVKLEGMKTVWIRANDSVDGYSELYEITLP